MDRSAFILAKNCDTIKPEIRETCCDSLMLAVYDHEEVNCEKYGYRPEWRNYANIFQKNMIKCFMFKRDGKCCVADEIKAEREKAEKEAKEKAEREAKEAKEKAEREVKEKAERELEEIIEKKKREAKEAREAKEKAEREAAEKLSKVAEQGDVNAQYQLGCLYLKGQGVPLDSVKGHELIRKAADQGNVEAKDFLVKEEEIRRKIERDRKVARFGLVLQFGMMATFFYMLLGTDVFFALSESKHLPLYLIFSGAISLAFGIVSLLFRRDTLPPFPAGIVFLLLMLAMTSITVSVLGGSGIIASILLVLITAIPASLLFFSGHWKWGIVFVVLMSIVGFIIIGNNSVFLGFSIIGFLTLSISAIPGIIIIKKAENDFSHGTAIASVIIALIIGGLLIWLFPNNKTESVTEAITSAIPNATVTSDTLNIRFLPRMNSKVIKTLKKSDAVYLTGDTIRKGWSEVEYADGTGCVTQDQVAYIFPRLGWWKVTGRQGSIKMTASMNIEEINNNNFSGYFQWREDKKNPGFYGKENFRGVYDPQTRKVSIQGYSLDERIVQ